MDLTVFEDVDDLALLAQLRAQHPGGHFAHLSGADDVDREFYMDGGGDA